LPPVSIFSARPRCLELRIVAEQEPVPPYEFLSFGFCSEGVGFVVLVNVWISIERLPSGRLVKPFARRLTENPFPVCAIGGRIDREKEHVAIGKQRQAMSEDAGRVLGKYFKGEAWHGFSFFLRWAELRIVGALGERTRPASRMLRRDPERRKIARREIFLRSGWKRLDAKKDADGRTMPLITVERIDGNDLAASEKETESRTFLIITGAASAIL
jgi:hypothetical protein